MDYTPLIGGAQGGLIRPRLQSPGISECLTALTRAAPLVHGDEGGRTLMGFGVLLVLQKAFAASALASLARDICSHPALREAKPIKALRG